MKITLLTLILAISANAFADQKPDPSLQEIIDTEIAETYPFAGLALYLNQVSFFSFHENELKKINPHDDTVVSDGYDYLVVAGRYKALLLDTSNQNIYFNEGQLVSETLNIDSSQLTIYQKNKLVEIKLNWQVFDITSFGGRWLS